MRGQTIGSGDIDSGKIWTPVFRTAEAVTNPIKYLLVPTNSAKKLRCKLIFGFNVIGKRVRVSHVRNLKTSFIKLGPKLQMMPCEADILPQNKLSIVADVPTGRQ